MNKLEDLMLWQRQQQEKLQFYQQEQKELLTQEQMRLFEVFGIGPVAMKLQTDDGGIPDDIIQLRQLEGAKEISKMNSSIDDVPIQTPVKDFYKLLQQKLELEKPVNNYASNLPEKPKKKFLRKGEGLARFRMKPDRSGPKSKKPPVRVMKRGPLKLESTTSNPNGDRSQKKSNIRSASEMKIRTEVLDKKGSDEVELSRPSVQLRTDTNAMELSGRANVRPKSSLAPTKSSVYPAELRNQSSIQPRTTQAGSDTGEPNRLDAGCMSGLTLSGTGREIVEPSESRVRSRVAPVPFRTGSDKISKASVLPRNSPDPFCVGSNIVELSETSARPGNAPIPFRMIGETGDLHRPGPHSTTVHTPLRITSEVIEPVKAPTSSDSEMDEYQVNVHSTSELKPSGMGRDADDYPRQPEADNKKVSGSGLPTWATLFKTAVASANLSFDSLDSEKRTRVASLQEELVRKDSRWSATQVRTRSRIQQLEKQIRELKDENEKLKQERDKLKKARFGINRPKVPSNTKVMHQINEELGKLKVEDAVPDPVPVLKKAPTVRPEPQQTELPTPVPPSSPEEQFEVIEEPPPRSETPVPAYKDLFQLSVVQEEDDKSVNDTFYETRDTSDKRVYDAFASVVQEMTEHSPQRNSHTDSQSPPQIISQKNKGAFVETLKTDGTREKLFEDGRQEIWFPNGNVKKISPDRTMTKVIYFNGDVKETCSIDGKERYFYAESKTWHTTYADGLEVLEFPDGQTERSYPDGGKEVAYPNGCRQVIFPEGNEEWTLPDGMIIRMNQDEKIMRFPNGQCEIHTKDHKRREYPDGTVKFLYPDGRQETRYSNGRIRLKDADGRVLMDTGVT